jgi:hypothetical protein
MKYCLALLFYIGVFAVLVSTVPCTTTYAHHKKDVLGESTTASELTFPPVTAGPGLLLPDNPFYFLDRAMQSVRLATAFSSEEKAKVRAKIAGERLAELRIMMARNNEDGIKIALDSLSREVTIASEHLTTAAASGKQVTPLAKELNETIKSQQNILTTLESQSTGILKQRLRTTSEALKEAKVEVEDELPEDELLAEMQEAIEREIEEDIHEASGSADGLEHAIEILTKLASQAATKEQTAREAALRRAIENKNEALTREHERLIDLERRKLERVGEEQKKASEEAKRTIREAQEAARRFREAQKRVQELQKKPANSSEFQPTPTPTGTSANRGSGSTNSGRGSENSGRGSTNSGSGSDDSEGR